MVSFGDAIKSFFVKGFDYKTRATRAEYWWVMLFTFLLYIVVGIIGGIFAAIAPLISLILLLPLLAVIVFLISLTARRLHDIGITAKWLYLFYGLLLAQSIIAGFISMRFISLIQTSVAVTGEAPSQAVLNQLLAEATGSTGIIYVIVGLLVSVMNLLIFVATLLPSKMETNKWGGPHGVASSAPINQPYSNSPVNSPFGGYQANAYGAPLDQSVAVATFFPPQQASDNADVAPEAPVRPSEPVYPPGHPLSSTPTAGDNTGWIRPQTHYVTSETGESYYPASEPAEEEPPVDPFANFNPPALKENPFKI